MHRFLSSHNIAHNMHTCFPRVSFSIESWHHWKYDGAKLMIWFFYKHHSLCYKKISHPPPHSKNFRMEFLNGGRRGRCCSLLVKPSNFRWDLLNTIMLVCTTRTISWDHDPPVRLIYYCDTDLMQTFSCSKWRIEQVCDLTWFPDQLSDTRVAATSILILLRFSPYQSVARYAVLLVFLPTFFSNNTPFESYRLVFTS